MNYSKPEVTVLGNAAVVIKGNAKSQRDQDSSQTLTGADCELDD